MVFRHLLAAASILAFGLMQATAAEVTLNDDGTVSLPYFEDFGSEDYLGLLNVIDANNDGRTWVYSDIVFDMRNRASEEVQADDWLLLPPMALKKDESYRLTFSARAVYLEYPERLEVKAGKGTNPEAKDMTISLISPTDIHARSEYGVTITVPEDGIYRIGFHAISDAKAFRLAVDDIRVDAPRSAMRPGVPTDASISAPEEGVLKAHIVFRAPTTTVNGSDLSSISHIEILHNGELAKRIENPVPGSMHESDLPTVQGVNRFTVIATNEEGEGEPLELSVFTGDDVPLPPSNLRMEVRDGKAYLSWDPPTTGENGGFIDPSALTYEIQRRSDFEYVETAFSGTEYVDELPSNIDSRPRQLFYCVRAISRGGKSLDSADSNRYITGESMELPFSESFAGMSYDDNHYWHSINDGERWNLQETLVYDGDNGAAKFAPANQRENSLFYTSRLSLTSAKNPLLTFYYWHVKNSDMILEVQVSRENGEFTTLRTFDFSEDQSAPGWKKGAVLLAGFSDAEYVLVGWKATAGLIQTVTALDAVDIRDVASADLGISVSGPSSAAEDQPIMIKAKVENRGALDARDFRILIEHEKLGAIDMREIAALPIGQETEVEFSVPFKCTPGLDNGAYSVRIEWEEDIDFSNDVARLVVTRRPGRLPKPEGLKAVWNGNEARIYWTEPAMSGPVTDDMEDYQEFLISDFGDWVTIDRDRQVTYKIVEGVVDEENEQISYITLEYPNAGEAMAFQVFDPFKAGSSFAEGMCHSGSKMLACFSAVKEHNDDWLISPELSGEAQTIIFWARSGGDPMWGHEKIEVYASDKLQEPEKFGKVMDTEEVPTGGWTEYKVALPEGTKHFAIRCVSEIVMVLFIDDITFIPKPASATLVGYDIYRDGKKLNDSPVFSTEYTDIPDAETASYRVRAVYEEGTSALSAAVSLSGELGVEDIASDAKGFRIETGKGSLSISTTGSIDITVHSITGDLVFAGAIDGIWKKSIESGIYIVTVNDNPVKVLVK